MDSKPTYQKYLDGLSRMEGNIVHYDIGLILDELQETEGKPEVFVKDLNYMSTIDIKNICGALHILCSDMVANYDIEKCVLTVELKYSSVDFSQYYNASMY